MFGSETLRTKSLKNKNKNQDTNILGKTQQKGDEGTEVLYINLYLKGSLQADLGEPSLNRVYDTQNNFRGIMSLGAPGVPIDCIKSETYLKTLYSTYRTNLYRRYLVPGLSSRGRTHALFFY